MFETWKQKTSTLQTFHIMILFVLTNGRCIWLLHCNKLLCIQIKATIDVITISDAIIIYNNNDNDNENDNDNNNFISVSNVFRI